MPYICTNAGVAQLVELQPSKLIVAGSSPVSRSLFFCRRSSGVERFLGKEEVGGSNPLVGSIYNKELRKISDSFFYFQLIYFISLINLLLPPHLLSQPALLYRHH